MPKYKCHKEVWALRIRNVYTKSEPGQDHLESTFLSFMDDNYADIEVDEEYISKHLPQIGGYYVVYKDGYKSFSPANSFEEGYTKIK